MTLARTLLFSVGLALVGVGAVFLLLDLSVGAIVGLLIWLAAAVVIHDGIVVPGFTVLGRLVRRVARDVPGSIIVVVEAAFAVGVLLTVVVLPERVAQLRGPRNPTVVPGDYLVRLGAVWVGIAVVTAIVVAVIAWRRRTSVRRASRSS